MTIGELFEILMVFFFGISWPMNVVKSYRSRTAKGKSLMFLIFVISGYIFGISGKLISGNFKWYVLVFYFINTFMVTADLILYFRNRRLDRIQST